MLTVLVTLFGFVARLKSCDNKRTPLLFVSAVSGLLSPRFGSGLSFAGMASCFCVTSASCLRAAAAAGDMLFLKLFLVLKFRTRPRMDAVDCDRARVACFRLPNNPKGLLFATPGPVVGLFCMDCGFPREGRLDGPLLFARAISAALISTSMCSWNRDFRRVMGSSTKTLSPDSRDNGID